MDDRASTFKKLRDASDPAGNLGFSSRMARKGLRASPSAPDDLERSFGLTSDERVLWRLLKIARKYIDLENAGVLPPDKVRGVVRGLVEADVIDVVEASEAKPIVPIEVTRLKNAVQGKDASKSPAGTSSLKARVFRPDISEPPAPAAEAPPPEPPPPAQEPAERKAAPAPKPAAAPKPAPAPEPAVPQSDDDKVLFEEIERRFRSMPAQNHYDFLEVQPSAPIEGVKRAYMKLARELHPDRIAGVVHDAALAERADKLFKRLQDAWSTLNDPQRRAQYDANLKEDPTSGAVASVGGKVRRTEEAKVAVFKADHFMKTKQYKEAEQHFKSALLLDGEYVPALLGAAWAIFLNEARDKSERVLDAKRRLAELADVKRVADAAYKLALIANVEGKEAEHDRRIEQACKLDPRHQEAQQELRLLKRRKEAKPGGGDKPGGGGGFFSKVLKR